MAKPKKQAPTQYDLFGHPIEEPRPAGTSVIPLDFETHAVRMLVIKGEPWWVAADVCRVLGIAQPASSLRLLEDEDKGVHTMHTLGGPQEMTTVNESGLYSLIFTSRKPEAKRFKKWVTSEVLPSIRKTGSYSAQPACRVTAQARKLKCDDRTAKARCDQIDINKRVHATMATRDAKPAHFRANHNAVYRGEFGGLEAADLRRGLGVTDSPLNHMEYVPLSINSHAKNLAAKYIEEHGVPLADQPAVYERFAREMTASDMARLGAGYALGMTDHPKRGRVLDVVRRQLPAASA